MNMRNHCFWRRQYILVFFLKVMEGMVRCDANFVPLTPVSFLERAAFVYGDRVSIVYGNTRYLWKETHERCIKLASALSQLGVSRGDIVAAIAPNVPELYELQFGAPMAGAVLCALNTKLNATILFLKLEQLEARVIFVDYEFIEVVQAALAILSQTKIKPPTLILIQESNIDSTSSSNNVEISAPEDKFNYQSLLARGNNDFCFVYPKDECDPISINYTSGSTGQPKGAIYSHRAAYLNSMAEIFRTGMRQMPVFLWTVDMFRCNGWCFPWTMAALGGTNICLRDVTGKAILDNIFLHNVTHFCGPPTILTKIAEAAAVGTDHPPILPHKVDVMVAGVMPHSQIRTKLEAMGFSISCAYGMSEALGPVISVPWKSSQYQTSRSKQEDKLKIREGIHNLIIEGVDVKDPVTMASVPPDGKTIGEVMFRSNTIMSGYLKNPQGSKEAFRGGWYRTKDLGVRNPDGNVKLKDRVVDIIVCGGEIISSIEVEAVLASHPMVTEAAVAGRPHDVLGEIPCAFVKLKEGIIADSEEIINYCASRLPDYKVPKTVFFGELPVNSTGKIQKFVLRERLMGMDG